MPSFVVSAIYGNKAAKAQASATEAAAETSLEATQAAIASQEGMFRTSIELGEPWRNAGMDALSALGSELGLGGGPYTSSYDPSTAFSRDEFGSNDWRSDPSISGTTVDLATHLQRKANEFGLEKMSGWLESFVPSATGDDSTAELAAHMAQIGDRFGLEKMTGWIDSFVPSAQPPATDTGTGGTDTGTGGTEAGSGTEYAGFRKTPGYEFQLDEGQRAINRSLAARGKVLSGPAVKEGLRFSQGLADTTYSNHLARLANMAGLGANVAGAGGNAAVATGQGIAATGMAGAAAMGNYQIQGGNARASGYAATGQAFSGGINNLAAIYGAWSA